MNWRPKDWKNPHHITVDSSGRPFRYNHDAYEGGADAMLQAVCGEIGNSLLTDEEIQIVHLVGRVVENLGRPSETVSVSIARLQRDKILATFQKEAR